MKNKLLLILIFPVFNLIIPFFLVSQAITIDKEQARKLIAEHQADPDFVLLDVRTEREFLDGHIEGAVLLDYYSSQFEHELKKMERHKIYLIYCRSGNRSYQAMKIMKKLGFDRLYNLEDGYSEWVKKSN